MVSALVSRRHLMRLGLGLGAAGLLAPLAVLAQDASRRRFLFVLAAGGWDPMFVFAPMFEHSHLHWPVEAWRDDSLALPYVASPRHPAVTDFFSRWGDRCCIVNGIEVPSVTHDQCRRLLLTGQRDGAVDDWGALIGGGSEGFDLPTVVVSGPSYTHQHSASVLRLGGAGQLGALVDGSALEALGASPLPSDQAVAAWRSARYAAIEDGDFKDALLLADAQRTRLSTLEGVDLAVQGEGWVDVHQRAEPALQLFEGGLSRCAQLLHLGQWDGGWDSHSNLEAQHDHHDTLFTDLDRVLDSIAAKGLQDEVTVVVLSEMGRAPQRNSTAGKDHWTWTSALLIGSGIQGGQVIGGFDAEFFGIEVEGRSLTTSDLGATLLRLADLDPALAPNGRAIEGILDPGV